ncbi:type I restriction endonuclease [Thioalkalivibrio sp.]|uniref:type I restriction endonuclease n=1 Tax=Thioalkalivibrio sp. TaxID=2093813 RepID=UPI003568C58E
MDFIDEIKAIGARASKLVDQLQTEEATKNALVMPFVNALGYNVFDPTEVVPEFTADVGVKKGEKVDYAIMKDGGAIMLFECKSVGTNLDSAHASQLYRYFSVTKARIGVLTNGIVYRFFSDLEEPNKMDSKPFLEISILNLEGALIPELKKLTKSHFDEDSIIETAGELKYTREIKRILADQLVKPDDEFVRFFASQVYAGRLTQKAREQFTEIVRRAFRHFINDQISDRLKSALEQGTERPPADDGQPAAPEQETRSDVTTTEEELEGYHIVRAILREVVEPSRIVPRDVKTYFGVLLDDNNRKPFCRLHFNTAQKYIGVFDNPKKEEERVPIDSLDDIYRLAERLKATPAFYEG